MFLLVCIIGFLFCPSHVSFSFPASVSHSNQLHSVTLHDVMSLLIAPVSHSIYTLPVHSSQKHTTSVCPPCLSLFCFRFQNCALTLLIEPSHSALTGAMCNQ
ncbi:hypothetical protein XENOCAPTIV_026735 [Xenoophorus captivus]|uniref:Secreted protein n=1 Tax=Xenoophorus captivus TaxID=1517983 RepID=A0ABV0SBR7_9TELE